MRIAVPKEIKTAENRIAITPAGVAAFVNSGHKVFVERGAGIGSGFSDEDFQEQGAEMVDGHKETFAAGDMVMKVKEPLAEEYDLFREDQLLFTYLHLAAEPELTRSLMKTGLVAIAYETVQPANGSLPLLNPMSEVAGRMATQVGAQFLEKRHGGMGVLLGGVPGVLPATVVVIGGGTVGINAAKMAVGLGASVTILDVNLDRLRYLDDVFGARLHTLVSNPLNIAQAVKGADLLIGAVLIPGARAPKLVTEDMVAAMKPGAVIVDVAIDQGGSIETIDRVTTHNDPVYIKHGVVHYSVANMPGAVPRTSTFALTGATMPYALALANKGWKQALADDPALAPGVNIAYGKCVYEAVAEAHDLDYTPLSSVLK